VSDTTDCASCNGTGEAGLFHEECRACAGSGRDYGLRINVERVTFVKAVAK
jgi:DnaJ-class molecular chaperone